MKIILLSIMIFTFTFSSTFAYNPTSRDERILKEVYSKINNLNEKSPKKVIIIKKRIEKVLEKLEGRNKYLLEELNNYIINIDDIVKSGDLISVHYTGKLQNGEQFDSSYDRGDTLDFTAGAGQMIKGFDEGVIGMKVGENKTLTLSPKYAYGEYDESKEQVVKKSDLSAFSNAGYKLEAGVKLPTQFGDTLIKSVEGENVILDLNHQLAGKTLIFDVEIIEIKK